MGISTQKLMRKNEIWEPKLYVVFRNLNIIMLWDPHVLFVAVQTLVVVTRSIPETGSLADAIYRLRSKSDERAIRLSKV